MKAKLVQWTELAPEVRHFEFSVTDAVEFQFVPGQFVSVIKTLGGKEITRAYSIASAPDGDRFALCLNRIPEGALSPYLFALEPGDEIEIGPPLGYFTLRNPDRDALFIATGTGVAPFRSILRQHLPLEQTDIKLLMGARYPHGLLYHDELKELSERYHRFRFLPTVTRPDETWAGRTGRVHAHLEEALGDRSSLDVYICGLKEMVDEVRATLKAKDFDRKQIIYEKYD